MAAPVRGATASDSAVPWNRTEHQQSHAIDTAFNACHYPAHLSMTQKEGLSRVLAMPSPGETS
jgi:hypothetical protein